MADIQGTAGADDRVGTFGLDRIVMLEGADTASGLEGNDTIYGNQGDDILYGNQGDDLILAGMDNDLVLGGQDNDSVYGNMGDDFAYGNLGDDVVHGGRGNDYVNGGQGNDSIYGGVGNDVLVGGKGDDFLDGGDGDQDVVHYDGLEGREHDISFTQNADGTINAYDSGDVYGHDLLTGIEFVQVGDGPLVNIMDLVYTGGGGGGGEPMDVITRNPDTTVDENAINVNEMFYGAGNTTDNWTVTRNETEGVETAMKVKERGGADYEPKSVDANGDVHYDVPSGEGAPGRAVWNFDFSGTVATTDATSTETIASSGTMFRLNVDIDPTAGVDFVSLDLASFAEGNPDGTSLQDSSNIAFFASQIDTDPNTAGIQPYTYGDAEFTFQLLGYQDGGLVSSQTIVVDVGAGA